MIGRRGLPQLEHLGNHDDATSLPRQSRQHRQRRRHGVDVGVVGVVDKEKITTEFRNIHPVGALDAHRAESVGDELGGDARGQRQPRGGQGVGHVVHAGHGQLDAAGLGKTGQVEVEGRSGSRVQVHVLGPQVGLSPPGGEGQDACRCELGHGGGAGVVGVEDGYSLGPQAGDDLRLGRGDSLDGAEPTHVGVADHEDPGRVQRGDVGEVGDVARSGGPHLQDEVAGGLVGLQHGQRQADLVVEAGPGGHCGAGGGQELTSEVLGGGLAHRAGHRHHGETIALLGCRLAQCLQVGAGQRAEGRHGVLHEDEPHGRVLGLPLGQSAAGGLQVGDDGADGAQVAGRSQVGVAVGALAVHGDEQ